MITTIRIRQDTSHEATLTIDSGQPVTYPGLEAAMQALQAAIREDRDADRRLTRAFAASNAMRF